MGPHTDRELGSNDRSAERAMNFRTRFIGRQREAAALTEACVSGTRLLSIIGPSGMGKTRLAHQFMKAENLGIPMDSRWFISLSECRGAGDLQAAVAERLGLQDKDDKVLVQALANRGSMLLVLDNFECVAREARPILERWLDGAKDLQIVLTSIVPSGLEDEIPFELGPMETNDALLLYFDRARHAWSGLPASVADEDVVRELVEQLDRSPLAIELAAARIRILPPRTMLARIESDRFDLLRSDKADRHGSLRRAIELTWEHLTPREQQVLSQSSIFSGGFTLEAAETILSNGTETSDLHDVLDELRGKSLLQLDDSDPHRFTLYDSIRDFAARKLESSLDADELGARHTRFFAEQGGIWAARVDGPDVVRALRWLSMEKKNLIAALQRGVEAPAEAEAEAGGSNRKRALSREARAEGTGSASAGMNTSPTPSDAARAGLALVRLLSLQGPPPFTADLFDATVEAARRANDVSLLGQALRYRAIWLSLHGTTAEAEAALKEGLQLVRGASERETETWLRIETGQLLSLMGRTDDAIEELERAVEIARSTSNPLLEGAAIHALGIVEEQTSRLESCIEHFQQASVIFQSGEHRLLNVRALYGLGIGLGRHAQFREARTALLSALAACREVEDLSTEADVLSNLGGLELGAGNLDDAESYLLAGSELHRKLGNWRKEAVCVANFGLLALERDDLQLAEKRLREMLVIVRGFEYFKRLAEGLSCLALAEMLLGKVEEARRSLESAQAHFARDGDSRGEALIEFLELVLDLEEARQRSAEAEVAAALERLEAGAAVLRPDTDSLVIVLRLVRRHIESVKLESQHNQLTAAPADLLIGPEAAWFEFNDGDRVDLLNRAAGRRILAALLKLRLSRPGVGLSQDELFTIGWPGEKIQPEAAAMRVYGTIHTLRSLGLSSAIVRHANGYQLSPELTVARVA